jgi:hypothetical protein
LAGKVNFTKVFNNKLKLNPQAGLLRHALSITLTQLNPFMEKTIQQKTPDYSEKKELFATHQFGQFGFDRFIFVFFFPEKFLSRNDFFGLNHKKISIGLVVEEKCRFYIKKRMVPWINAKTNRLDIRGHMSAFFFKLFECFF